MIDGQELDLKEVDENRIHLVMEVRDAFIGKGCAEDNLDFMTQTYFLSELTSMLASKTEDLIESMEEISCSTANIAEALHDGFKLGVFKNEAKSKT